MLRLLEAFAPPHLLFFSLNKLICSFPWYFVIVNFLYLLTIFFLKFITVLMQHFTLLHNMIFNIPCFCVYIYIYIWWNYGVSRQLYADFFCCHWMTLIEKFARQLVWPWHPLQSMTGQRIGLTYCHSCWDW